MTDRPTPEQIQAEWKLDVNLLADLRSYGYVIVHPDDVPDWIERLSENPLGTPIYSYLTPQEAAEDFMDRFVAAEQGADTMSAPSDSATKLILAILLAGFVLVIIHAWWTTR